MPAVALNGTELFYAEEGSGNPILFIPGLGGTHGMFEPQAAGFQSRYRVIRPDLRGNGQSGRLTGPIHSVLDRQCDDLAALCNHLGISKFVCVGVSYGGAVAFHLALRYPERLAGLVVADSFAELRITRLMEGLILVGSYLTLWAYYLPRPLLKALARRFYRRWPAAHAAIPGLVDAFRPSEAVLQSIAMCRIGPAHTLGRLDCPTLGIVGAATQTGIRLMAHAMAAIPGSRLDIVQSSFDPSNLCQPEEFNRSLDHFLRAVEW